MIGLFCYKGQTKTTYMKTITFLFCLTALLACNKNMKEESKNSKLVWADNVWSTLPLEADTVWEGTDFTNASNTFDREKLVSSITKAVLAGKLKAYSDFPNKALSVKEVQNILVKWDSTATCEDPNNPGVFISAPIKMEIDSWSIPYIKFNEKIELDTLTYTLSKKTSYITLFNYKRTEKGETVGIKKLFDVQFNE